MCLNSGPGLVGPKPLSVEDGALYPLGSRGAQCLTTAISGLLLQVRIRFVCLSLCLSGTTQMSVSLMFPEKQAVLFLSDHLAFQEY